MDYLREGLRILYARGEALWDKASPLALSTEQGVFDTLSNEIRLKPAFIWLADFLAKGKIRIFSLHGQKI